MSAALYFTLLLLWSTIDVEHVHPPPLVSSHDRRSLPLIQVALFAPLDVKDSLVSRICDETDAIWRPAGITFEWHRITSTETAHAPRLDVAIDEGRSDGYEGHVALGWIPFTSGGPLRSIHLSRSNAEALLLRTPGVEDKTLSTHERLLGRALGRALSHELGHYFLRSKLHTSQGLMRAVRSSEEFFRISRDGFELNGEERQAAALYVRGETSHDGGTNGNNSAVIP